MCDTKISTLIDRVDREPPMREWIGSLFLYTKMTVLYIKQEGY